MTLNDKFNLQYSCKECGGMGNSIISVRHTDECEVKKKLKAKRLRNIEFVEVPYGNSGE